MKRFLSIILATIISFSVLSSVSFAASDYNSYRAEVDKLNKMDIPLRKQAHRLENKSGLCNVVAATQLLNRRIAYDLGDSYSSSSNITLSSVISQCGNIVHQEEVIGKPKSYQIGYSYSGKDGSVGTTIPWYDYSYTMPNGYVYAIKLIQKKDISGSFNEYLAKLLMQHPEGVHYRTPAGEGGHCIVISDFYKNGNDYTFYAIDGTDIRDNKVDGNRLDGREEWIKTSTVWNNGATDLYKDMDYIAYIDIANSQIHTCLTKPEELNTTNYHTSKDGVLGACRGCGKPYNWQDTFTSKSQQFYLKNDNKKYKAVIRQSPYKDAKCLSNDKVFDQLKVLGTVTNAYGNLWYAIDYTDDNKKMCYTAYVHSDVLSKYNTSKADDNYASILPSYEQPTITPVVSTAKKYEAGNLVTTVHKHDYNYDNGMCRCGERKVVKYDESTLKIDLTKYPSQHTQGNNLGLRGTISSNYNIKKIYGYIKQNGNIIQSTEDSTNSKSIDVKEKKLNNNLIFQTLSPGNYTLEVQAIDASGNSIRVSKDFTVVGEVVRAESTLSINLEKYPVTLNAGSSFGLRGSVNSNYDISVVRGYVINSNGQTVLSSKDTPYSTSLNIKSARLNNDLVFNNLSAGNYTLKVVATDRSGRTVEVSKGFSVVSPQKSNNSTLSINLEKYPVTLKVGSSYGLRGSVTSNYNISVVRGYVTNSNGQTVLSSKDTPDSSYMDIRYANLNEDLIFNNLSAGNYTMKVVAVDASGRTVEATKNFTVKAKEAYVDNSPNGNAVIGVVEIPSSWDNLSIRNGPSKNYDIISNMENGDKCTVYPNKTVNGWYYVNYNGIWGYASGNQIKLNKPSNNTQASTQNSTSTPQTSIKFELEAIPEGNMPYGKSFTLKGWFRSDSAIVEARAYILDANKNVVMQSGAAYSTTSNYKIQGYMLDKAMKFDELIPGGYYLKYYVRDANGDTATWMSDKFYIVR